jgi:hypothetical protein
MNDQTRAWYESPHAFGARQRDCAGVQSANRVRELQRGNADFPDTEPAELYQYLGMSYERMGMNEKHWKRSNSCVTWIPGQRSHAHIGTIQFQMGHAEDAATSLTQCVILDPQRRDAWQLLIQIYSRSITSQLRQWKK